MKLKDISESLSPSLEGRIDSDSKVLRGVAIASTRKSANGYVYSDKSFNTLTSMAEGASFYLDHPSKDEQKARDGVRSVRDFAGVFRNSKRSGDKVTADLHVHDQYWDFMQGVVRLQPEGMGLSINSRVRVITDDHGNEEILDLDKLNSVDFVSSPALNFNLWESIRKKDTKDIESAFDEGVRYGKELASKELQKIAKKESMNMSLPKPIEKMLSRQAKKAEETEIEETFLECVNQPRMARPANYSTIYQKDRNSAALKEKREFAKISDEDESEVLESLGNDPEYRDISKEDEDEILKAVIGNRANRPVGE